MERKILFSRSLKEKFDSVNYESDPIWGDIEVNSTNSLMGKMIKCLNEKYSKLHIKEYEFKDEIKIYNESSTYFGVIENEKEEIEGYIFVIPPAYATRSGVLAQQVFPVLSGLIPNANEVNQTPSMAINIFSGEILGFKYVDIFDRVLEDILKEKDLKTKVNNIIDYNEWLIQTNKEKVNEFFELNVENKTIKYLVVRLKDGIKVNNEPYWFVLKAYASLYLALKDGYKCDMSVFDTLQRGNKTLDAFRDYINNFNKEV